MRCGVPGCNEEMVMQGVCSSHWLEADEAVHGAQRIEDELAACRREGLS